MTKQTIKTNLDLISNTELFGAAHQGQAKYKKAIMASIKGFSPATVTHHVKEVFNTLQAMNANGAIADLYQSIRVLKTNGLARKLTAANKALKIILSKQEATVKGKKGVKLDGYGNQVITAVSVELIDFERPTVDSVPAKGDGGTVTPPKGGKPHSNPKSETSAPQNKDNKQDKITAQTVKNDFTDFMQGHTLAATNKLIEQLTALASVHALKATKVIKPTVKKVVKKVVNS